MELFLYTALFAPLVGSLFAALFGASKKTKIAGIVPSALLGVSLLSSFILLLLVFMTGRTIHVEMMTWMATGDLYIPFGFVVDQVSVTMMMVVTLVSTVVLQNCKYSSATNRVRLAVLASACRSIFCNTEIASVSVLII